MLSALPEDSLAPAWLQVPEDANDLPATVWPASAKRDAAGALTIGGVSVAQLREQFGTPLYVLDEAEARAHARGIRRALSDAAERHGTTARVYYAGKAFLSTEVVRWVTSEGLRVDVCSRGELETALAAGVDPAHIGYHGNNKRISELERAIEVGVGSIIIDSEFETERIAEIAARLGVVQNVMVRVNTGIHAETHDFLATAHEDQKFGVPLELAPARVARIRELPSLRFLGAHCHIGSQIFGSSGFAQSAARMVELHAQLLEGGDVPLLNLGGGFGIAYTRVDQLTPFDELANAIVDAVAQECQARKLALPELAFEPGRAVIGQAGVTLYEVGTTKNVSLGDRGDRLYVSVDGGMSDNARPALYGAQYSARLASRAGQAEPALVRVVGSHCESGDIVVDHEYLPSDVTPGDLLAVPATGAYCYSLSSNYNLAQRPAVIAVRDGEARVIVRGETLQDVLARDLGIAPATGDNAGEEGES